MDKKYIKYALYGVLGLLAFYLIASSGDVNINEVLDKQTDADIVKEDTYLQYKDISTPDDFINTDPVTIAELLEQNKVVLVDFWTYSCINCQRTLPYLKAWHDKYSDDGLIILGVHTPEFDFEKELDNVQAAVDKYEIEYPVVLDNDFSTWHSYQNRFWPRKYLIDIDGYIVYDRIGEGGYEDTETAIKKVLAERAQRLGEEMADDSELVVEGVDEVDFSQIGTPEIYFGSSRVQKLDNLPSQVCLSGTCNYELSQDLNLSQYALGGTWSITKEKALLESDSGSIKLRFLANKVNIVAGAENDVQAQVYLDGVLVNDFAGNHVLNSTVTISDHDLYNLIDLKGSYEEHVLEIRFQEKGVSIFTFTFG